MSDDFLLAIAADDLLEASLDAFLAMLWVFAPVALDCFSESVALALTVRRTGKYLCGSGSDDTGGEGGVIL